MKILPISEGAKQRAQSGISRVGTLMFVLIIAAGVFAGSQIFPFYYYYYELQGLMEAQAEKANFFSDAEMRRTLLRQIKKLEIPIADEDDLKINRFGGKIRIQLEYNEVFFLDLGEDRVYDLWVFEFDAVVERNVK